jgi:quercetin dioxygenase-like cupin family protein
VRSLENPACGVLAARRRLGTLASVSASAEQLAHLVSADDAETVEVLGPRVEYLTAPEGDDPHPCVMRGTVPPDVIVPLHSHPDPETFLMQSGSLEGLVISDGDFRWVPVRAGDTFHVPPNARHAWRNTAGEPAVSIIVSTVKMGRFFCEVGSPVESALPPSPETIERFLETAERYGYWNAPPEENAAIGLPLD